MLHDVVMDCGVTSMGDYCATFWYKVTVRQDVVLQSVSDTASCSRRRNSAVPVRKSEYHISQHFDFDLLQLIL